MIIDASGTYLNGGIEILITINLQEKSFYFMRRFFMRIGFSLNSLGKIHVVNFTQGFLSLNFFINMFIQMFII